MTAAYPPEWADSPITDTDDDRVWAFVCYFDAADETFGPDSLTLDDLDPWFVKNARQAAEYFGLAWPPYLPAAEEYALAHPEVRGG